MTLLEIKDIYKKFGENEVLRGVNLSVEKGKVYSIMGENGSGKSTLFNILSGFVDADSGSVLFEGKEMTGLSPDKINRMGIGRSFQDLRLARKMTVRENAILSYEKKMFGRIHSSDLFAIDNILNRMSLSGVTDSLAGNISYGQQKLLTLACLIANDSNLLLIDEPVAGIDANNMHSIATIVRDLVQQGKTIIQVEHNDEYIDMTSDYVVKMEGGQILC